MDIQSKLKVLAKIGQALNDGEVTWAVGASLLLYIKGIVTDFHDIDLMVAQEDIKKTRRILASFGSLQPSQPTSQYKTADFLEFVIDGVDVDVMGGLVIVADGKSHAFPLQKEGIHGFARIGGVLIPLQSVKEWRIYYALMGRTDKIKIIDIYNAAEEKPRV